MIVYNMSSNQKVTQISRDKLEENYFIISDFENQKELLKLLSLERNYKTNDIKDKEIDFQIYESFDFVSLSRFGINKLVLESSKLNFYLSENIFIIFTDTVDFIHSMLEEEIQECLDEVFSGREKLNHLYYHMFHLLFRDLFIELENLEEYLLEEMEKLAISNKKVTLNIISSLRRISNQIVRNTRLLSYVTDEILANEGGSLLEGDLILFQNIDSRANKLYDFSLFIQEESNHLLDTYNSKINEQTNMFINAFTVFTVFITPLSFLTGLFAVNFLDMPVVKMSYGLSVYILVSFLMLGITAYILKKNSWI